MKKIKLYIITFITIFMISMLSISVLDRENAKYDDKLEPAILRVVGFTSFFESSNIVSIVQYYNVEEGLHYYEVEYEYEYFPLNEDLTYSDELLYSKNKGVYIINHNYDSVHGEFFRMSELELDRNKEIYEQYIITTQLYEPLVSYNKDELVPIVNEIKIKYGLE